MGKKSPVEGLMRSVTVFLIIACFSIALVSSASARSFRLGKLPDKGKHFGCATCHVNPGGGGTRNPFGLHYQGIALKAGDTYTKKLGVLDSDKDGFTNDEEFSAGTNPGDSSSIP